MPSIRQRLRDLGALPGHERLVLRHWLQGAPLDTRRRRAEDFLPKSLRTALPGLSERWHDLARIHGEHPGEDGSLRLLVRLADGQTVESVLLPRDGLCVSTQVGCAVGCLFCMTGKSGLIRQLSSDEIVAQVTLARARRRVKKVVFMGMGEPLHNLDNVMEAIDLLGTEGGIGHKNLVFSTVGDRPLFARLQAGAVKPALAISLHTTDPATGGYGSNLLHLHRDCNTANNARFQSVVKRPSEVISYAESVNTTVMVGYTFTFCPTCGPTPTWAVQTYPNCLSTRHNSRNNVLFADGHVEAVNHAQLTGNDKDMWGHSGL